MRFVETKRGTYEVLDDNRGLAVAVSTIDNNDVFQFGKRSCEISDDEIIDRVNAVFGN